MTLRRIWSGSGIIRLLVTRTHRYHHPVWVFLICSFGIYGQVLLVYMVNPAFNVWALMLLSGLSQTIKDCLSNIWDLHVKKNILPFVNRLCQMLSGGLMNAGGLSEGFRPSLGISKRGQNRQGVLRFSVDCFVVLLSYLVQTLLGKGKFTLGARVS